MEYSKKGCITEFPWRPRYFECVPAVDRVFLCWTFPTERLRVSRKFALPSCNRYSFVCLFVFLSQLVVESGSARGESGKAASEYGDVAVDEGSTVSSDLFFDPQRMHLYVMTERKVRPAPALSPLYRVLPRFLRTFFYSVLRISFVSWVSVLLLILRELPQKKLPDTSSF